MKLLTAGAGSLLVAGTVFALASTSFRPQLSAATDNAYVHGDITPISPPISGYIVDVAIRDHQSVREGDVLFRIDDRDYVARRDQARAALAARRAVLQNLGSQIARQHSVIEQAEAVLLAAEAAAHRADLAEAKAHLAAARRQLDVLMSERPQLQADIDAAAAALQLAEIDLGNTAVRAPSSGHVGERQAKVGQYVRPGTLLVAIVGEETWIVANFKETQLPRIGDRAAVSIDGIPHVTFRGRIESISPASGARFALLPPDNATGNFTRIVQRIPVKIVFDAGQPLLGKLRPGMSAEVETTPAHRAAGAATTVDSG